MTTGTVEDTCIFVIEKNSEQRLSILLTVLTIKTYDLKSKSFFRVQHMAYFILVKCHPIDLFAVLKEGGYIIMIFGKNINFNLIDSVELNVPRTVFTFC